MFLPIQGPLCGAVCCTAAYLLKVQLRCLLKLQDILDSKGLLIYSFRIPALHHAVPHSSSSMGVLPSSQKRLGPNDGISLCKFSLSFSPMSMASYFTPRRVLLWVASPLLIAIFVAYWFRTATDVKSPQCAALSLALHGKVSYPASSAYAESSSSYWSKQEESLAPTCIVSPTSTDDVVTTVKALALLNSSSLLKCNFAIRGGGHTPWAGSANINGGVTIDMRSINAVTVSKDNTVASVGAGAVWGNVYQKMDSLGLAVVGGRGSSIGVGGLLTGGK